MDRPYLFAELTNSVCSTCLRKIEAKVIIQDDKVYLQKFCPTHKLQKVLIADDVDYWLSVRRYLKPGQLPRHFNTPIKYGCPYDCGLCPDHEQHSCLAIVEITDQCNLYEKNEGLKQKLYTMFASCGCDAQDSASSERPPRRDGSSAASANTTTSLKQLLCCLPTVTLPSTVTYQNLFRVIVMQFLDAHNFGVRSVKKSCVHIVHPDGRIIPFDTFNLFYRDEREQQLTELRAGRRVETLTRLTTGATG